MELIKKLQQKLRLNGEFDKKIDDIYKEPIEQTKNVSKSLKEVNKLLFHKSVNYYIVKAMGVIK